MNTLKMLGYRPKLDTDVYVILPNTISFFLNFLFYSSSNTFRQNLVSGDKSVVFPILQWLLDKVPEHQERAYLGRYLSKADVPTEFLSDPEIAEQYEHVKQRICLCFISYFFLVR
jgi:hypothetical protein